MDTLANVAELLILVGAVIAVLIFVDRFWAILTFCADALAAGQEMLQRRRTRSTDKLRNRVVVIGPWTAADSSRVARRANRRE